MMCVREGDKVWEISDAVHLVEDILKLALGYHAELAADGCERRGYLVEWCRARGEVDYHHHIEIAADDGLTDIENVDAVVCEVCADACYDAYIVLSYYGDYRSCHSLFLLYPVFYFYYEEGACVCMGLMGCLCLCGGGEGGDLCHSG